MPAPAYTSPLAEVLAPTLLERFLRYVRIDTQSRRDRTSSPSTLGPLDLARMLVHELRTLRLSDADLDANGYVMATLEANTGDHEYHSVREWASVQDMAAAAATIVRLAEVWTRPEFASVGGRAPTAPRRTAG